MVDDSEAMVERRLEEDDDPGAVARDAAAADENADEYDPDDLDYERPDERC